MVFKKEKKGMISDENINRLNDTDTCAVCLHSMKYHFYDEVAHQCACHYEDCTCTC